MKLIPILPNLEANHPLSLLPEHRDMLLTNMEYYQTIGFKPPWIAYFAEEGGKIVGSCAFKGAPKNRKVEIAYVTFEAFRRQGVAQRMCRRLLEVALAEKPSLRITAQTLPEKNYSTRILEKNGFTITKTTHDEEVGEVWEWEFDKPGKATFSGYFMKNG